MSPSLPSRSVTSPRSKTSSRRLRAAAIACVRVSPLNTPPASTRWELRVSECRNAMRSPSRSPSVATTACAISCAARNGERSRFVQTRQNRGVLTASLSGGERKAPVFAFAPYKSGTLPAQRLSRDARRQTGIRAQ